MFDEIDYYRVKWGDTLKSISQSVYGGDQFFGVIYRHNSTVIPNPNNIAPGTMLAIPKLGAGNIVDAIIQNFVEDD